MTSGISAMAITWNGAAATAARRGSTSDRDAYAQRLGRTDPGRPPGAVGVRTVWAMYLVLFVGSAIQWLLQA